MWLIHIFQKIMNDVSKHLQINIWFKKNFLSVINRQTDIKTLIKFGLRAYKSQPKYENILNERSFYHLSDEVKTVFSKPDIENYLPSLNEITLKAERKLRMQLWIVLYCALLMFATLSVMLGSGRAMYGDFILFFIVTLPSLAGVFFLQSIFAFNIYKLSIMEAICGRVLVED